MLLRFASDDRLVEQCRAGSDAAFEAIFDRHHRGVLAFCRHMVGSAEEAEDAVQHTFLAAYRDLVGSDKPIQLRPWLYTIARNRCLSVLRGPDRSPHADVEPPPTEHLSAVAERRQDLRDLLADLARLPDDQRAALVLAEVGDMSHEEIAAVLSVRREKVKALVFQARTALIAGRTARETPCAEIREQLASLTGGAVLRRHLRECAGCREYRDKVRAQRRELALVLPVAPTLALKAGVLAGAGAAAAGAGGGAGAAVTGSLAAKALVAVALAGGGAAVVETSRDDSRPAPERAPAATVVAATPTAAPTVTIVPVAKGAPVSKEAPVAAKRRGPKPKKARPVKANGRRGVEGERRGAPKAKAEKVRPAKAKPEPKLKAKAKPLARPKAKPKAEPNAVERRGPKPKVHRPRAPEVRPDRGASKRSE